MSSVNGPTPGATIVKVGWLQKRGILVQGLTSQRGALGFHVLWCWPYFRLGFWVLYLLRFGVSVLFCFQFPIFGFAIRYGFVVSCFFSENVGLSDLNCVHIFSDFAYSFCF